VYLEIPDVDCRYLLDFNGVLYIYGGILLWLMLSDVVFRSEVGSETISVSYTLIFVSFVNLMVQCM
jgi:hypothetical protein